MTNKNETVTDVIGWLRMHASFANANGDDSVVQDGDLPNYLYEISDRIEAAYNRLAIPTAEQWTKFARQGIELADVKRENEHLREALKPIKELMAYNEENHGHIFDGEIRIPLNVMLRQKVRSVWHMIEGDK